MTVSSSLDHVRAQYEALPYPPRDPRDEAIRLVTGTPSHLLEVNHYLFSGRLNFIRPFRALVAGGGTGLRRLLRRQHERAALRAAQRVRRDRDRLAEVAGERQCERQRGKHQPLCSFPNLLSTRDALNSTYTARLTGCPARVVSPSWPIFRRHI